MGYRISRRELMKRSVFLPVLGLGAGTVLWACGDDEEDQLSCNDTSGLAPDALQLRQQQEYTDDSPYEDKVCSNCRFWQPPPQAGTCGGCQVIKGPIHPAGYCKLWAAKA